jgi:hypothetical protein
MHGFSNIQFHLKGEDYMKSNVTKCLYIFIIILLFQSIGFSQYEKKVDGVKIKQYITSISTNEYAGRETGTKGGEMGEEFFAKKYEELKLKPIGVNNSYYHYYTIPFNKVESEANLTINDRKFYYGRNEDFNIERNSLGGNIAGEIAFAGYGIISKENNRNDFENIDIKGKIVLIKRGCPNNENDKWKESAADSVKAEYCHKNGAIGILFFESSAGNMQYQMSPTMAQSYPRSLSRLNPIKDFPIFRIEDRVVRFILEGMPNERGIQRNIDQKNVSCLTGKKATMSVKIDYDPERKVRNVLAMIPGTDSKLKNEAIVIGGHMDHIGKTWDGKINFGADDNASGPSVALGVAEAMLKNKFKPKRTIIFAGWSGEEEGLLGSAAWCKTPTWDLNKIVVYFNLDMVGLGDVKLNFPGIYYAKEVWKFLSKNVDSAYLKNVIPSKGGPGGSDHTPFLQKGVPAFAGMTGGQHPDYHTPGDVSEKIDGDVLQFVGDYMYKCIELLANSKENFIPEKRNENIKFQMANIINPTLLPAKNFRDLLKNKDQDITFIDFSESVSGEDYNQNFLKLLRLFDDSLKSLRNDKEYALIQNLNDGRFLSYQNKSAIVAEIDLSKLGYDDLLCRMMGKAGARFGIIKKDAPFAQDKSDKKKTLVNMMDAGLVITLDNMSQAEISNILNQVEKPVAIQSKDISILNDDLIKQIKAKGHLFIYQFTGNAPAIDIVNNMKELKSKLGESSISVSIDEFNTANYEKYKEVYALIDKGELGEGMAEKMFSENFITFATKAVQERQQQMRGRPF